MAIRQIKEIRDVELALIQLDNDIRVLTVNYKELEKRLKELEKNALSSNSR